MKNDNIKSRNFLNEKIHLFVIPDRQQAETESRFCLMGLDSRLRGNDKREFFIFIIQDNFTFLTVILIFAFYILNYLSKLLRVQTRSAHQSPIHARLVNITGDILRINAAAIKYRYFFG